MLRVEGYLQPDETRELGPQAPCHLYAGGGIEDWISFTRYLFDHQRRCHKQIESRRKPLTIRTLWVKRVLTPYDFFLEPLSPGPPSILPDCRSGAFDTRRILLRIMDQHDTACLGAARQS